MRKCNQCEWQSKANEPQAALTEFAAHYALHNSTPAQWTDAYNSILRAKERAKKANL